MKVKFCHTATTAPDISRYGVLKNGKYHNTLCSSTQILNKHCFCFLLGPLLSPKRNWELCLFKIWVHKQRVLSRVQMRWICPLYKLSTSWAHLNNLLRVVERCWVLLSQIWNWSNFSFNTAQHFLYFAVIHVWLNKVECICTATLNMLSPRTRSAQRIHWEFKHIEHFTRWRRRSCIGSSTGKFK